MGLKKLSVMGRLSVIVLVAVLGLVLSGIHILIDMSEKMYESRQTLAKAEVESAHAIASGYYHKATKGEMPVEEAKAAALTALSMIRYQGKEYVWVNDLQGVMLMHPFAPKLVGNNILGVKDPDGKALFIEMIDVARSKGSGFVRYQWNKPNATEPTPKVSFVQSMPEWGWVIGSGLYLDDVNAAVRSSVVGNLITGAVVLLVMMLAGYLVARAIARPVQQLTDCMLVLADGRLDVEIPARDQGAELGAMAQAVQVFKENALAMRRLEQQHADAELRATQDRRDMMHRLADEFEASVRGVVRELAQSSMELRDTAESMNHSAMSVTNRTTSVAASSEQATMNVDSVAAATEQMTASVNEISQQVLYSVQMAGNAVDTARSSEQIVRSLSETAGRIGEVVTLINAIASQTNLLALNATIEAARAGEAGKGFAVVANEVKGLANQTSKATEEIANQIKMVQEQTHEAVQAIGAIGHIIDQISQVSSAVSAAVEEQGAATREISRNTQEAATGTRHVSEDIAAVQVEASHAGSAAQQVLSRSQSLSHGAETLEQQVNHFLASIRAE